MLWPITTIDFEASSLEQDGYPIEVGLARWPSPGKPILGWSALIRPAWRWAENGHWSALSATVHGLREGDLVAHGRDPAVVAAALNQAVGPGGVAWCDGGAYDAHWLRALFTAGGVEPVFTLDDWGRLIAGLGAVKRRRALGWLDRTPARHRAGADAARLLLAVAHGLGRDPGAVGELALGIPALAAIGTSCDAGT